MAIVSKGMKPTPGAGEGADAKAPRRPKAGMAEFIAGEAKDFKSDLTPYLPGDLVGGSIPQVPGMEMESVWNAASQACGTERVHFAYSVEEGRCWYLACPSQSLASNPDSWCPLAAALPGNSEYWDRQTVYLYEQEGMASALRWDPETGRMQVFLGAARTLLPRIQSMDANFVTLNPDVAQVVPWNNRQLRTELLGRSTARALLFFGLAINFICIIILVFQILATNFINRDLQKVRDETDEASNQLMLNAYQALQSESFKHMVRIQQLLDALTKIDGTLVKYEVNGSNATWEAVVPPSFGSCNGSIAEIAGCKTQPGLEPDGRVRIKGSK